MQKKLNIIAKLASAFMLLLVIGASAQQTAEPKEDKGMDFFHGTWAEAKAAALDNVRDRALRAEATWRGLADQARAVAMERAKVEQEKAAQREAAAAEAE